MKFACELYTSKGIIRKLFGGVTFPGTQEIFQHPNLEATCSLLMKIDLKFCEEATSLKGNNDFMI
jgi:hypothetical protein